jgi:hypothetical protein
MTVKGSKGQIVQDFSQEMGNLLMERSLDLF